ncbi:DUF2975 domain-containing protein [Clostridium sp. SHJSY1]|uniref:DUF2975 domain-containing protein n=1 Tax=Clostridium sp. SHJSY1 TaxID=2942483 RepID=UPI00287624A0|nr:DUF2975 domain-containing protein [Clostridium sp. SHJSY1]MDS0525982.1 DUF2975 domain-containing protein [Clostridium sp. SHJSY1]
MNYYGKKSLSSILNIILSIMLFFGVILTGVTYYKTFSSDIIKNVHGIILIILLTIGVISTFTVVIELKKVIKTLVLENPFIWENVKALKKITISCFTIAGCYLINFLMNIGKESFNIIYIDAKGVHTDAEIFIFLLVGCFVGILSKVFEQAVKYKEDNDLTI